MKQIVFIFQIIVSSLLIVTILLQQRGQALGSSFGGEGTFYLKRRGLEKTIFISSIILGVLFVVLSIANLFI